jgi:hypothetical protein
VRGRPLCMCCGISLVAENVRVLMIIVCLLWVGRMVGSLVEVFTFATALHASLDDADGPGS